MIPEVSEDLERKYIDLLDRIVKGAVFIENLDSGDARYKRALERYDKYCADLMRIREILDTEDSS